MLAVVSPSGRTLWEFEVILKLSRRFLVGSEMGLRRTPGPGKNSWAESWLPTHTGVASGAAYRDLGGGMRWEQVGCTQIELSKGGKEEFKRKGRDHGEQAGA